MAPRHAIAGGKVVRRSTLKTCNRAGHAFRLAAQAVRRRHKSLGAFSRRLRARRGSPSAMVATAHTLARIVYHVRTPRTPFHDLSATDDEQRARERDIAALRQKARRLGFTRVASPA